MSLKLQAFEPSAGLAFMQAAQKGLPRALGDRNRIAVMDQAMEIAVRNRFAFDTDDGVLLRAMGIRACVGIFNPLSDDYYRVACEVGGTYPRMWERWNGIRPWVGRAVWFDDIWHNTFRVEPKSRIAESCCVLMPADFFSKEDQGLAACADGSQIWWCTAFSNDQINLCRYRPADDDGKRRLTEFVRPRGSPERRQKLSREEWEAVQARLAGRSPNPRPRRWEDLPAAKADV